LAAGAQAAMPDITVNVTTASHTRWFRRFIILALKKKRRSIAYMGDQSHIDSMGARIFYQLGIQVCSPWVML